MKNRFLVFYISLVTLLPLSNAIAEDWVYTVKKGDTLWHLCLQHTQKQGCWQLIGPYNGVTYPKNLAPGTRIKFPTEWLKQQPQPALIHFFEGDVSVTKENVSYTPTQGMPLHMGAVISVGAESSATIQFADHSTLLIEENSEVRLDRLSTFGGQGMVDTHIFLNRGSIRPQVKKKTPPPKFNVHTPSAVAAVRGTEFRVTTDAKTTRTAVYEGGVSVENDHSQEDVDTGYGLLARIDEPLPTPVKLLPAPDITSPHTVEPQKNPYTLRWNPLPGASLYKIEIATQAHPEIIFKQEQTDKNKLKVKHLEQGCYVFRVSGQDQAGFFGMPATATTCVDAKSTSQTPWIITYLSALALMLLL